MPGHQLWNDYQTIQFQDQVVAASWAPVGQYNWVTDQVKALQAKGKMHIEGGLQTELPDPFPNQEKVFQVWYMSQPSERLKDGETLNVKGQVVACSYAPVGQFRDLTQKLQALQMAGKTRMENFHDNHYLGDPFPGVPKQLQVWYA